MLMDFAPLEKLAQRLVWMAILGAGLVVVGLVFGLALGIWSAASVALAAGAFALLGGLYWRRHALQMTERLRKKHGQ
jgi:hypothetical protein